MNELEEINLHEHLVRKSVAVLLFKGALAWLAYFIADYLLQFWENNRQTISLLPYYQTQAWVFFQNSWQVYAYWGIKLIFGLAFLYIILSWIYEYYIFKIDRIIVRQGILFSRETIYELENVRSVDVVQGLIGKILDTGTVKFVYGARGLEKTIYLTHIPRPYHVAGHAKKQAGRTEKNY